MNDSAVKRISYYLRKINQQLASRYHMDYERRERRHNRLMQYKAAMHKRLHEEGWKNVPL